MVAATISAMCAALGANGPAQDVIGKNDIFGWLVGSWDIEVLDAESEGMHRVNQGEWHFAWVLEGRAIQDVLIAPKLSQRRGILPVRGNRYGTGLRVFDATENVWRSFWINPVQGTIETLRVEKRDGEIMEIGEAARHTFSAITRESFHYVIETMHSGRREKIADIRALRTS